MNKFNLSSIKEILAVGAFFLIFSLIGITYTLWPLITGDYPHAGIVGLLFVFACFSLTYWILLLEYGNKNRD